MDNTLIDLSILVRTPVSSEKDQLKKKNLIVEKNSWL